jgi:hypothetical protein
MTAIGMGLNLKRGTTKKTKVATDPGGHTWDRAPRKCFYPFDPSYPWFIISESPRITRIKGMLASRPLSPTEAQPSRCQFSFRTFVLFVVPTELKKNHEKHEKDENSLRGPGGLSLGMWSSKAFYPFDPSYPWFIILLAITRIVATPMRFQVPNRIS